MYQSHERRLPILPFTLEKVRATVLQFILCNIAISIIGLLGAVIIVSETDSSIITILQSFRDFNTNCNITTQAAFIGMIVVGVLGILTHFAGYPPRLLCSLPCLVLTPFGLIIIGLAEASVIEIWNGHSLSRAFLHEAHYYNNHESFFHLSNDKAQITELQEKFNCCGIVSNKDFYLSKCNCMPISCCKKVEDCKLIFTSGDKYTRLGFGPSAFKSYQEYIWEDKCAETIQSKIADLKRLWIHYCIIHVAIYCIFAAWYFHITAILKELIVSKGGYVQLQIFKAQWPTTNIKVRQEYKDFTRATDVDSSSTASESDEEQAKFDRLEQALQSDDAELQSKVKNYSSINLKEARKKFREEIQKEDEIEDDPNLINIFLGKNGNDEIPQENKYKHRGNLS